jgi:uncharacterized protein (TIGR02145 family)
MKNFFYKMMAVVFFFAAISCKKDAPVTDGTVPTVKPEETGVVINGVKWATRNLASHGKFVEKPEDYGALFQWGRKGDGHEQRSSALHSGTVSGSFDANGQILSSHAAYGKFITTNTSPYDWRSPQLDTLWNSGTTPVKTVNDPCPVGWRLPTQTELSDLVSSTNSWVKNYQSSGINGRLFGTAPNQIFLPAAGGRNYYNGGLYDAGSYGNYWSSRPDGTAGAYRLYFNSAYFDATGSNYRAHGFSVRCVAEL